MNDIYFDKLERSVLQTAQGFAYPPTPTLSAGFFRARPATQSRTWAYALVALLVALAALLAVPEVRARLLEFLQIGAVRIEVVPTATVESVEATHQSFEPLETLISVSSLSGETTLEDSRANVDFPIPLPGYPVTLGSPDRVYLQSIDPGRNFVILVWLDPDNADEVELAQYVIGPGVFITKGPVDELQATRVNGNIAAYVRGPHFLEVDRSPNYGVLVQAPALIWEADGITYRIEADLPLEELVRIAESLE